MSQAIVGFKVACRDGWAGTLKKLIVNPVSGKVTYLIVEMLSNGSVASVPVEHLSNIGYETVFLNITSSQLKFYNAGRF